MIAQIMKRGWQMTPPDGPEPETNTLYYEQLAPEQLGAKDGRGRFREIYKAVNDAKGRSLPDWREIENVFRDMGDEGTAIGAPVNLDPFSGNIWVVAVGGYLSACMRWMAPVFGDALSHLKELGANTTTALVAGRCGTVHNSEIVRDTIDNLPLGENDKVIIVAHSKGVLDTMEMISRFPQTAKHINAFIGVTGAVGGSPLVTELPYVLRKILVNVPLPTCSTGDKLALRDLEPEIRKDFLSRFTMPEHIKSFSIATWPNKGEGRDNMSTGFRFMRTILDRHDLANDGQVLVRDMIIPGSTMLGIIDADHAAVAMPFARNNSLGAKIASGLLRDHNAFPREIMVEAAVRLALEDMS